MYCCNKRKLSITDESIPVFSLDKYEGYAKVTDVYDGDTFKACIVLHNTILKFTFRTVGYDAPEMKPPKDMKNRDKHVAMAKRAKYTFASFLGYDEKSKQCSMEPVQV